MLYSLFYQVVMTYALTDFFPFFLLAGIFCGCWVLKDHSSRGALFGVFLFIAIITGRIEMAGVIIALVWGILWASYAKEYRNPWLFILLILLSFGFKFHYFPGFNNLQVQGRFWLGIDSPLIGLFPLMILVPLASTRKEWRQVFLKGSWLTVAGIGGMTALALASGTVHWGFKLPPNAGLMYFSNLFLTAIPEEAFYRGFVQGELARRFKMGKAFSLILSSLIFTAAHLFWSPSLAIFAFIFLAGLLYGGVYMLSGRIESAILCHFLLNFTHMTFFTYHAV